MTPFERLQALARPGRIPGVPRQANPHLLAAEERRGAPWAIQRGGRAADSTAFDRLQAHAQPGRIPAPPREMVGSLQPGSQTAFDRLQAHAQPGRLPMQQPQMAMPPQEPQGQPQQAQEPLTGFRSPMVQQGLLGLGMGLLEASGPSTTPTSFGQALSRGMGAGVGMMQQEQQNEMQRRMFGLREQQIEADNAEAAQKAEAMAAQRAAMDEMMRSPGIPDAVKAMGPEAVAQYAKTHAGELAKPPAETAAMQDARALGFEPGTAAYNKYVLERTLRPQSVSTTNVNMAPTPFETEYDKARGKSMADAAAAIQDAGRAAEDQLAAIGPLMASLANPDVYQGTGGPAISNLKRFGGTMLGLDFEGVGDAEVARTLGNQMAMSMRSMLPGPMSDGDRAFLQSLPPNLGNSREGNVLIGEFYRRSAERNVERAQAAREYEARTGRVDPGFDREWAEYMRANSMFDETDYAALQEVARATPQPSPLAGVPDDITAILGRYGVGGD